MYSSLACAVSNAGTPGFLRSLLTSLHAPARGRERVRVGGRAAAACRWCGRVGGAGARHAGHVRGGWRACVRHLLPREPQALQSVEQPPHHGLVERRGGEHALQEHPINILKNCTGSILRFTGSFERPLGRWRSVCGGCGGDMPVHAQLLVRVDKTCKLHRISMLFFGFTGRRERVLRVQGAVLWQGFERDARA